MRPLGGLQNQPVDPSLRFAAQTSHYFLPARLEPSEVPTDGELLWEPMSLEQRISYHQVTQELAGYKVWSDVPEHEYEDEQKRPFQLSYVSPRTVRLRLALRPLAFDEGTSLMVEHVPADASWATTATEGSLVCNGPHGRLVVHLDPWRLELRDGAGRLLTRTNHLDTSASVLNTNPMPFCGVRNSADLHRWLAASFLLSPGERLYGGGESFTRLDKRGQKLLMWTCDAYSSQTPRMYKPIPFFLSSRGYGMFLHSSAAMAFDLGHGHSSGAVLYVADDVLDLFLFIGDPKAVLAEYTALTGRPTVPPQWTFGLWMGRESYETRDEVLRVAHRLRDERIPCDAIHIDTHWPEVPMRCDFQFSKSRFPDPKGMTEELRRMRLRLSLWQFPYFHPADPLHEELVSKDFVVRTMGGRPPVDDAILDLTNEDAVDWYKSQLSNLLAEGVDAFTSDFGEAAPLAGIYSHSSSAAFEHNLYPLRYARAVAEATKRMTGHSFQFLRSAWAGSQRHPVHFGGDSETSDGGLNGALLGGLSLGLSGFTFWSHILGGFAEAPSADLYLRWLAVGALTSHMRCHGAPPREPWEFDQEGFTASFRRIVEFRYRLLPYVYAQAHAAAETGHPMMRPLFFDHPKDPISWLIEDEYMFGTELLVAPLFENHPDRVVYLPPGGWVDYQSGACYKGGSSQSLEPGSLPIVVLAREGAVIPHAELAQSVDEIDWERMHLNWFGSRPSRTAYVMNRDGEAMKVRLQAESPHAVAEDPSGGAVRWTVVPGPPNSP